ncbi:2-(1,2-epoxy-1,2-dihydrophenyl)acetyl-CoA isomerase [Ochrobactrum sp. P6BSIII]|uniref:enoyl-CoA hydratase-related protein n=1 Tax=unclassified Ochrobactrum TaxID=239106 RepID=UPI0009921663|nr:2-(1,2-epoxy-1,2-dihydrophenyl)acetyl-CoA isomerase [Ochrobactrum sp. P6BSIII]
MSPVLLDKNADTGVATITFNRPDKLNALNEAMAEAFKNAVDATLVTKGLRCIVLRGAGRAFVAGGDIVAFAIDPEKADLALKALLRHMHPAILALQACPVPVIAVVQGPAAGAGLSLVLGCDYVISNTTAQFVLAYDKLATVPDCGGTWFLKNRLGRQAAFAFMLRGQKLTAAQAYELGIVNEIINDDEFTTRVSELVTQIASGPTHAYGLFKRLMVNDLTLSEQLEAEQAAFIEATYTQDFRDAVRNFLDKKPTLYSGR